MDGYNSKLLGKVFSLALCSALAGCTIHPTPIGFVDGRLVKDLTVEIVKRIRCETRDALLDEAIGLLQSRGEYSSFGKTTAFLAKLSTPPLIPGTRKIWDIHPIAQIRGSFFLGSKIKLNFDLMVSETNTNALQLGISPTTGPHVFKLGIADLNAILTRKNQRQFNLKASTFGSFEDLECDYDYAANKKMSAQRADWAYPIRGNVNLAANIRTFKNYAFLRTNALQRHNLAVKSLASSLNKLNYIKLSSAANDAQKEIIYNEALNFSVEMADKVSKCDGGNAACVANRVCYKNILQDALNSYNIALHGKFVSEKAPIITDILTFTTNVNGGINPSITFANGAKSFKLANLGLKFNPGRVDTHKLTINLEAPEKYAPPSSDPVEVKIGGSGKYKIFMSYPADTKATPPGIKGCPIISGPANNNTKFSGNNVPPTSNKGNNNIVDTTDGARLNTLNKGELERTEKRFENIDTKNLLRSIDEKIE